MRKTMWLVVSGLMVLSLVMAACGPPAAPTAPTTPTAPTAPTAPTTPTAPTAPTVPTAPVAPSVEKPQYGGTLTLAQSSEPTSFDAIRTTTSPFLQLVYSRLTTGDWARGPAGGYGTKETDWGYANNDLWGLKTGLLAESWKWTVDEAKDEGTIVFQIRKGVHWFLDPKSEASRLLAGREVTADDIVYGLTRGITEPLSFAYNDTELRSAKITKSGPWEVTIKLSPISNMALAVNRFSGLIHITPQEVVNKYKSMDDWKVAVGYGPFYFLDYVPGSVITLARNPGFYRVDPVGPGKGNQLPYLDKVMFLIMPDASTRQAALRVGKIDQMSQLTPEDAEQMRKTAPAMLHQEAVSYQGRGTPLWMDTRKPPFSDIRVRRAMMMAIDFQSILDGLFGGKGQILTWPYAYTPEYAELHLSFDDPMFPETARELYKYNPDKAKQLLKEAGYPNGFKTSMILDNTEVDYYSIIKDYWSKVGIDLALDVKTSAVRNNLRSARQYELVTYTTAPVATFYTAGSLQGIRTNYSYIDDSYVDEMIAKYRTAILTDVRKAMAIHKELRVYLLPLAFAIPNVTGYVHTFWWPWLKNYSGEITVGWDDQSWPQYIWYDQALKKSMGH